MTVESGDARRFDRIVAAVLMPVGPAAVAILRFVLPQAPVGASVTADPAAQRLVVALGVVIVFTLVPGAFAAVRVLRPRAPRMARWTAALLIPGYLALLGGLLALDTATLAAFDAGFDPAQLNRLNAAGWGLPSVTLMAGVFVVGHISGTVLLGIAATVTRTVPILVGVLLAISQPLHLVSVIIGSPLLDLIAWATTALGMAFLGWRVLQTPNDEWDVAPLARTTSPRATNRSALRSGVS